MTPASHLLALVSILIGIALADLSVSLHRLLRARRRIRWDWLPLGTALVVSLMILQAWWAFYRMGQQEIWTQYWSFLVLAFYLMSLFLLASAALPDEVPETGLDLRGYYRENQRYFWSLFAVSLLGATGTMALGAYPHVGVGRLAIAAAGNMVMIGICLSLAWSRSRLYHGIVVALLALGLALQWSRMKLG